VRRRFLLGLVVATGCGSDVIVVVPVIDSPPPGSDEAAFPNLDEVELSVALPGSAENLVSATFARGEQIELTDVPFGEDLVIHMIGRVGSSEVAAGRTCQFALRSNEPPPTPHLYFALTPRWANAAFAPSAIRVGGVAIAGADGSGLFLGGTDGGGAPVTGADRFDPQTGAFGSIGTVMPRLGASAAQLDGSVVIAGGTDVASGAPAAYVELARPDRVERFDAPLLALTEIALVELEDGRALSFGGRDASAAVSGEVIEIRPVGSGVNVDHPSVAAPQLATPRAGATATRLADGSVIVIGGLDAAGMPVATAELYKPVRNAFSDPATFAPAMIVPRSGHKAIRLPDGSVLVVGGIDAAGAPVRRLESFSVDTGFVDAAVDDQGMPVPYLLPLTAGITDVSLTPLPDTERLAEPDAVLLAGGRDVTGGVVDTAFIIRVNSLSGGVYLQPTGDRLATRRAGHQATLLCDGTVMLVGGTDNATTAERYNPPSTGRR